MLPLGLILPPGITGFDMQKAPHPPTPSFRAFRTVYFTLAWQLQGGVGRFTGCEGGVTPDLHTAELNLRSGSVSLLCNAVYPWLAAVFRFPDGFYDASALVTSDELEQATVQTGSFHLL